jgi:hypothetical protein
MRAAERGAISRPHDIAAAPVRSLRRC